MNWYETFMAEILLLIKDKNLLLEINTRSLSTLGVSFPNQQFYSLINDLQIPIVVNSDFHEITNIKDGFEVTFEALKKAGFKTMHQLINSKWQAVEFDEKGLIG
jgi:histidinol-phosphatase (PHP family)